MAAKAETVPGTSDPLDPLLRFGAYVLWCFKDVPQAISSYAESGNTLYASLAGALDSYVAELDPSHFAKETF